MNKDQIKAFLEVASDQEITKLFDAARFYGELHDKTKHYLREADADKQPLVLKEDNRKVIYDLIDFHSRLTPAARQFLTAADESTFRWLLSLRSEEVASMQKRTKANLALLMVGQFGRYLIIALIATFAAANFGSNLKGIFSWFLQGGLK